MAVFLSPVGGAAAQFFTNDGTVLSGGKLNTYTAGTTTPAATYTTSAGTIAHSNPIILNSAGRVSGSGEIWLTDGITYKFVLTDANNVLIATYDNINGINDPIDIFAQLANTSDAAKGDALIGFKQANPFSTTLILTGAVARTVHQKFTEMVSLRDFGAVGDGTTNDTTAFQAAITACANNNLTLFVPDGTFMYTNVTVPSTKALSICGSSNTTSIFKQIAPGASSTAGITATGGLSISNVGFDQNWTASGLLGGYNDSTAPTTWGGYWVITVTTTDRVNISDCYFTNIGRGVLIVNSTEVDFFNNYSNSLNAPAQSICATSGCQQVSMNDNTLIAQKWSDNTGNVTGLAGLYNFNAINLELCNNTTVGHQWVGRGSPAVFAASITDKVMTVSSVTSGALSIGQTFSGTNVYADNTIVSQVSGTPGGVGVYNVAFTNTGASGTFTSYMARLVVADNIIDTPVADTAFYGYKNATITGNVVRMSGDMGITIDGSQYVSIVGNSINGTRIGGINVSSAYSVVVANNNIKDIAQGSQGPYENIDQYGRFASNGSQWLSGITVNFLYATVSKGVIISGNTMYFENPPPATDIYGTIAPKVYGIFIESTTNSDVTAGIITSSITGNYVEPLYSTVPQFFVVAFDHRFYHATGGVTGTPILGEKFTDGANSFVIHQVPGNNFVYLKKLIGTVGNGVTFTGALSGATILTESAGGGAQLTYLGITGAGNNDWTTTYANMNVGV